MNSFCDSWALVAYACNPSYLGGWNQEDQDGGQPGQIIERFSMSKITRAKWTGGMAQAVGPWVQTPVPPKNQKQNQSPCYILLLYPQFVVLAGLGEHLYKWISEQRLRDGVLSWRSIAQEPEAAEGLLDPAGEQGLLGLGVYSLQPTETCVCVEHRWLRWLQGEKAGLLWEWLCTGQQYLDFWPEPQS
jgi:hypothetical protein